MIMSYQIKTETIKTTISDHYTDLGASPGVIVEKSKISYMIQNHRDREIIDISVSFRSNTQNI